MDEGMYRLAMLLVAVAGIWEGLIAVIFRLFTDKGPSVMTAANYLDAPWCYVVAGLVVVVALGLLSVLDKAHKRVLNG